MSNKNQLQANNATLSEYIDRVNAVKDVASTLPEAGGGDVSLTLQDKEVYPDKSTQLVTADDGHDGLSSVKVHPIPEEYIIPSGMIVLNKNGYYDVTEYETAQVVTHSGGILDITENGSYEVGDFSMVSVNVPSVLTQLLARATFVDNEMTEIPCDLFRGWQYITKISLPNVTETVSTGYVCYGCTKLEEVYMPECTNFGNYSFYNNTALTAIDFPKLTAVPANCFRQCTSATSVNLPVCTSIAANAFQKDALIEKMDFPMVSSIAATAFDQCSALTAVILRVNKVCTLANVSAFNNTPIKSGTGYIYVPASLVNSYKSASNWSTYAAQIRAIEDYPEICGG